MPSTQQQDKRAEVIFASAGVGAGHNQAAHALMAGLNRADSTVATAFVDVLEMADGLFKLWYAGGYAALVTRAPWLYGLGYRLTDHPRGPRRTLAERRRMWSERRAVRRFSEWVLARRPAVVVSTHFLPPPMIGAMIAQGVEGLRQMVVVTDHDLHRYWCAEHVDRFFVAGSAPEARLVDFGIDPVRIDRTGIPIHPKWTDPIDTAAARAAWDVPEGRPVVVISGGTDFEVDRVDKLAARLCREVDEAVVIVLAGTNKKLLSRLATLGEASVDSPRLRPVGFTDRIHELVHLADLVITKAGGMTVSECVSGGAAMVLLKPIPGQEAANARWLCDNGAAVIGRNADEILAHAVGLLRDRTRLERLQANARQLASAATEQIVGRILELVG